MFLIKLVPQSASTDTQISASGDVLTINGGAVDFSVLGEGEQCETTSPLVGVAQRVGGVVRVGVLYRYDSTTAEPMQSTNPADYLIELTDGELPDPIKRKPEAVPHVEN